jgi:hypothetical protein
MMLHWHVARTWCLQRQMHQKFDILRNVRLANISCEGKMSGTRKEPQASGITTTHGNQGSDSKHATIMENDQIMMSESQRNNILKGI